jgi:hypothetical protein
MTNNLFCFHNGKIKPGDKLVNSETCPNRTTFGPIFTLHNRQVFTVSKRSLNH